MELIIFIAIISYVVKAVKKANEEQMKSGQRQSATYQMPRRATRMESARVQVEKQMQQLQPTQQEIRAQIEKTKQRIMESRGMTSVGAKNVENQHFKQADMHRQQENREAMQQVHAARVEANNTTIMQMRIK